MASTITYLVEDFEEQPQLDAMTLVLEDNYMERRTGPHYKRSRASTQGFVDRSHIRKMKARQSWHGLLTSNTVLEDSLEVDNSEEAPLSDGRQFPEPPPSQTNTLHKLPPEIRLLIFEDVLTLEDKPVRKDGRDLLGRPRPTPSLLMALRGDLAMYQEALEVFYYKNIFTINIHNFVTVKDNLSSYVLSLIKNLKIEL